MTDHILLIKSLRDIDAECSCGRWSLMAPTSDHETDEQLHHRITAQWEQHAPADKRGTTDVQQAFMRLIGNRRFLRDIDLSGCSPATIRALKDAIRFTDETIRQKVRNEAQRMIRSGRLH